MATFYRCQGGVEMVIDIHSHLGNILYPCGGDLIFRKVIKFPRSTGLQLLDEKNLFRETKTSVILNKLFPMWSVNCERRRNAAATLENFQKSLVDTGIVFSVCAPIAPNNTYEDMRTAAEAEPHIIAFTSPDFTLCRNDIKLMKDKLASDFCNGAAGLKIHPILQEFEADSNEVMETIKIAEIYLKPVLLHAGKASYYKSSENKNKFTEFASIPKIEKLISTFPNVSFIVGHAGLGEIASVIDLLPKYKNAYVDTSFQTPEAIKALISVFGGNRVLFASDWPYGLRQPALSAVKEACENDIQLRQALLYDNAAELLKIRHT